MIDLADLLVLGATALGASLFGSVAGSGSSAFLLPVLIFYFGVQQAVPIITIANMAGNLSRAIIHRNELDWRVVGWFSLGSIPLALLGSHLFTVAAPDVLTRLVGAVLILLVAWRRLRPAPPAFRRAPIFLPVGVVWGFLAGLLIGVGPLMAPFYLAFGLMKGAYIGTDALATMLMQVGKLSVFGRADFLRPPVLAYGLALTPFMVGGTLLGKRFLDRLPERAFTLIIEVTLVAAGLNFLVGHRPSAAIGLGVPARGRMRA